MIALSKLCAIYENVIWYQTWTRICLVSYNTFQFRCPWFEIDTCTGRNIMSNLAHFIKSKPSPRKYQGVPIISCHILCSIWKPSQWFNLITLACYLIQTCLKSFCLWYFLVIKCQAKPSLKLDVMKARFRIKI